MVELAIVREVVQASFWEKVFVGTIGALRQFHSDLILVSSEDALSFPARRLQALGLPQRGYKPT